MRKIIDQIFAKSDHSVNKLTNEDDYYSYKDVAYYFLIELAFDEFEKIKHYSDFTNLKKYTEFKKTFDLLEKDGVSNAIERNSSLIVLVKCNSLIALEKNRNQILILEEDEYFFKKYVILYSEKSIDNLKNSDDLMLLIQKKIKDENKFNLFSSTGFQNELEEYLLIIQLYIKLPFLKIPSESSTFQPLDDKLTSNLGDMKKAFYMELISRAGDLKDVNIESEDAEDIINDILKIIPND